MEINVLDIMFAISTSVTQPFHPFHPRLIMEKWHEGMEFNNMKVDTHKLARQLSIVKNDSVAQQALKEAAECGLERLGFTDTNLPTTKNALEKQNLDLKRIIAASKNVIVGYDHVETVARRLIELRENELERIKQKESENDPYLEEAYTIKELMVKLDVPDDKDTRSNEQRVRRELNKEQNKHKPHIIYDRGKYRILKGCRESSLKKQFSYKV